MFFEEKILLDKNDQRLDRIVKSGIIWGCDRADFLEYMENLENKSSLSYEKELEHFERFIKNG